MTDDVFHTAATTAGVGTYRHILGTHSYSPSEKVRGARSRQESPRVARACC